jgi:hypothetical protein
LKATRNTKKLVDVFEEELDKAPKAKRKNNSNKYTTAKKVGLLSLALLTVGAATYAIFNKTGQLDLEDFARVRRSI